MSNQLHNELKKEFQLERLILFSDAVFAIAITLLVIEIKIPEFHNTPGHIEITDENMVKGLKHLVPKFIGFIISFILIGLYWTVHHRMFGFVTSYNKKLLVLNLLFLFFIVLMPFSTGFYGEYAPALVRDNLKVPLVFYVLNFAAAGIVNFTMWRYIGDPKNKLAEPAIAHDVIRYAKMRSLTVPIIFLSMIPVAYLTNVQTALYMPLLIPITMRLYKRMMNKKVALKATG